MCSCNFLASNLLSLNLTHVSVIIRIILHTYARQSTLWNVAVWSRRANIQPLTVSPGILPMKWTGTSFRSSDILHAQDAKPVGRVAGPKVETLDRHAWGTDQGSWSLSCCCAVLRGRLWEVTYYLPRFICSVSCLNVRSLPIYIKRCYLGVKILTITLMVWDNNWENQGWGQQRPPDISSKLERTNGGEAFRLWHRH